MGPGLTGAARLLLVPLSLVAGAVGVVAVQGASARRTIERLPEADGLVDTCGPPAGAPLHLVVLGDSVAAGVGIAHHDATLAGRLAALLSDGHAVRRTVVAQSGLTAGGVLELVGARAAELASADVVVLSVGVNDAKGLHSTRRWRTELTALLDAVGRTAPRARVVLLGVPDMSMFTRLPRPLRSVMGMRSRALDRVGRSVVSSYPSTRHLLLSGEVFDVEGPFAADGFHPSEAVHAAFAREVHRLLQVGAGFGSEGDRLGSRT